MHSNSEYVAPCFSENCGFCPYCCEKAMNRVDPSEYTESARVLKKFMGIKRVNEELENYNISMNAFAKRTGYVDPKDIGFTMQRQWNNSYRYQLIQKEHEEICDDALCKVFFISSDKIKQEIHYPKYPLYKRRTSTEDKLPPHYLCALCVR